MKLTALLILASLLPATAGITVKEITKGLERPVWAGVPTGVSGKLWVIEQVGLVWIIDEATGTRSTEPFLDIRKDVSRKGNEEGLLGLAFAPDFKTSGRFYVNYTDNDLQTRIFRYTSADQQTTDPTTGEALLTYPSYFRNHNGGWLSFGPDGMLYIGNGDGGQANDPKKTGQDLSSLLGKMLRIDVSPKTGYTVPPDNPFLKTPNAKPEVWAYGLRNPWRCSFDRETGDLWIADVGQNALEEINYMPKGKASGANFGWRLREAEIATPKEGIGGPAPSGAIDPVYSYKHGGGPTEGNSVTGGYVYRGSIKELQGRYIFADYTTGHIWSLRLKNGKSADFQDHTKEIQPATGRINLIASFAEDNDGELRIIDATGTIYQIIAK